VNEKVFLGVVTCRRDDYVRQVARGMKDHLAEVADLMVIVHDGPTTLVEDDVCHFPLFTTVRPYPLSANNLWPPTDQRSIGVGATKNKLLKLGLDHGADWLFLLEDDVVSQSPEAVTGYIAAAKTSGWEHLSFAHHGPANSKGPVDKDPTGATSYYPAYVGAFCLYSRRSIETCGFFDETFVNSWDHVEHTLRLSLAGFHPLPPEPYELRAADATGSENWLREIPGSIENTSIPHTDQWKVDRARGREHWKATYPASYQMVFSR
jgi:hypothetical protein